MTLGERLKERRLAHELSQEQVAERLGISRQAVAKWEGNHTSPSADNLLALADLYQVSLDELAGRKVEDKSRNPAILRANLTRIAIIAQAAALNICLQPADPQIPPWVMLSFKGVPLLGCSIWMACNLRYEKRPEQRRKNARIELLYCLLQAAVMVSAHLSRLYFLGTLGILGICLAYVLWVNPKYMNRVLTRKKR